MPKTLKFKAWDKTDKKIEDVFMIDFQFEEAELRYTTRPFEDIVLLEYTGILDKNGKEIYENDLIKSNKSGKIYKVVWNVSSLAFEIHNIKNQHESMLFINCLFNSYKVIGNVFENYEVIGNVFESGFGFRRVKHETSSN